MTPDSRMLLQASVDLSDNTDEFIVSCPVALSMSLAVGAALNLMTAEAYIRRAVIEKLLSDGLAIELTRAKLAEVQ